jgi:hypothetical protein
MLKDRQWLRVGYADNPGQPPTLMFELKEQMGFPSTQCLLVYRAILLANLESAVGHKTQWVLFSSMFLELQSDMKVLKAKYLN